MIRSGPIWRTIVRAVVLALIVAAAPLPALADEGGQAAPAKPGIRASLQTVAVPTLAPPRRAASSAQSGTQVDLESPSFFKTRVGIMVLGVVAAGTAYAIYSSRHDRINSPGR